MIFIGKVRSHREGRYIGGVRDKSAPTEDLISLLNFI